MLVHFKLAGDKGSVKIDRERLLFTYRPARSTKTYTLPLDVVALGVMWRIEKANSAHAADLQPCKNPKRRIGIG